MCLLLIQNYPSVEIGIALIPGGNLLVFSDVLNTIFLISKSLSRIVPCKELKKSRMNEKFRLIKELQDDLVSQSN